MSRAAHRGDKTIPKEVRRIVRKARALGWDFTPCGSGHFKLSKPGHMPVFISGSSSDRRAASNIIRDMKKAGVPV